MVEARDAIKRPAVHRTALFAAPLPWRIIGPPVSLAQGRATQTKEIFLAGVRGWECGGEKTGSGFVAWGRQYRPASEFSLIGATRGRQRLRKGHRRGTQRPPRAGKCSGECRQGKE